MDDQDYGPAGVDAVETMWGDVLFVFGRTVPTGCEHGQHISTPEDVLCVAWEPASVN